MNFDLLILSIPHTDFFMIESRNWMKYNVETDLSDFKYLKLKHCSYFRSLNCFELKEHPFYTRFIIVYNYITHVSVYFCKQILFIE